jgi:hypothetical protein
MVGKSNTAKRALSLKFGEDLPMSDSCLTGTVHRRKYIQVDLVLATSRSKGEHYVPVRGSFPLTEHFTVLNTTLLYLKRNVFFSLREINTVYHAQRPTVQIARLTGDARLLI